MYQNRVNNIILCVQKKLRRTLKSIGSTLLVNTLKNQFFYNKMHRYLIKNILIIYNFLLEIFVAYTHYKKQ